MLIAALLVCPACGTSAQAGDAGASSADAPVDVSPRMKATSRTSIESHDEAAVLVSLTAAFDNPDDVSRSIAYWGALALLDGTGAVLHTEPVQGRGSIAAGGHYAFEASSPLARELLESLSSVRLVCAYTSEGATHIYCQARPVSVEAMKADYLEAEALRIQQERIAAWFERFPTDDYSSTLLIGDSIMQNATASLRDAMPGVTVDADAGRTLETGGLVFENSSPDLGVLDHVRNDDGAYARYVIGTGNNDPGGMTMDAAEEIIACLGEEKEIYFVTEAMTFDSTSVEVTNATIADVVERYPNVHAIDWHGLVAGHEYDYLSDAVHPRRDREPDYAACIKQGLDTPYPR